MNYPKEFVEKVKKEFPTFTMLHTHLDIGSTLVGRILCDSMESGMSNTQILSATSLEEVQEKARKNAYRSKLYSEWLDLYRGGADHE